MTQAALATAVGISQPAIADIERRGSTKSETLKKIAKALDVRVEHLLD